MKKSLVFAMALALGVTASAYAANPFSDVPQGHWAYDSVAELAAAGVIDGYGDGTYGGDKLMTRYEMAQIVAKAMAKGANVDALAAEFASELDTLGVRVAALEKKADNVKITGQVRAHYKDQNGNWDSKIRTRLFLKGKINKDWTYTGRIQNEQKLTDHEGNDETKLNWAFVDGKIGGVKVTAGRQDFKLYNGHVIDTTVDGIKLSYGDKVKLTAYLAEAYKVTGHALDDHDRIYIYDLAGKLGKVNAHATYYYGDTKEDIEILAVGGDMKLGKNVKLLAEYLHGDAKAGKDSNGWMAGLAYKGAKAAAPGSWGIWANYYDQPVATMIKHTSEAYATFPDVSKDGIQGIEVGANYALAKNIVAAVRYFDLETREDSKIENETLWSELVFTF